MIKKVGGGPAKPDSMGRTRPREVGDAYEIGNDPLGKNVGQEILPYPRGLLV